MKTAIKLSGIVLFTFFTLSISTVLAQDYKAVKTDASYYFYDSIANDIIAIKIDSTAISGDDILYFNFPQIRPTENSFCYISDGASWLGDPVIEKPGGIFLFKTVDPTSGIQTDTLVIKTQATLNEIWEFTDFPYFNNYIEAKVTAIVNLTFLGLTDSVKIITLTRKDASGTVVPNAINGEEIHLSKNYGLIRLPKFDSFYDYLQFYKITGKTNPAAGTVNPTAREVFNFEPGDEIHTKYTEETFTSSIIITGYTDKNIVSKTLSQTDDWVAYRYSGCHLTIHEGSGFPTLYESNSFDYIDTIFYYENPLNFEPNEAIVNTGNGWMYGSKGLLKFNRSAKLLEYDNSYNYIPGSNCWSQIYSDGLCPPYYITGLGGPYYNCLSYPYWSSDILEIIYYKKGSETWGTPLSCDSLQHVGISEIAVAKEVNIYPNPTKGTITVSVPTNTQIPCKIELFDISGRFLKVFTLYQQTQSFDLSNIPAGLYNYKVTTAEGDIFRGKIIRQ
jgi:hypothetical protein